jgi:hypothetical protein
MCALSRKNSARIGFQSHPRVPLRWTAKVSRGRSLIVLTAQLKSLPNTLTLHHRCFEIVSRVAARNVSVGVPNVTRASGNPVDRYRQSQAPKPIQASSTERWTKLQPVTTGRLDNLVLRMRSELPIQPAIRSDHHTVVRVVDERDHTRSHCWRDQKQPCGCQKTKDQQASHKGRVHDRARLCRPGYFREVAKQAFHFNTNSSRSSREMVWATSPLVEAVNNCPATGSRFVCAPSALFLWIPIRARRSAASGFRRDPIRFAFLWSCRSIWPNRRTSLSSIPTKSSFRMLSKTHVRSGLPVFPCPWA